MKEAFQKYVQSYPKETSIAEDFMSFLSTPEERPFERSNKKRHITASAWLISPKGNEVLLTHHRKLNRWLQLGGHCDGSPDVLASAIREAEEESGISDIRAVDGAIFDIDKHLIPERRDEPEHFHYDVRFLLTVPSKRFVLSSESNDLKWFHYGDQFFNSPDAKSLFRLHAKWLMVLQ